MALSTFSILKNNLNGEIENMMPETLENGHNSGSTYDEQVYSV